MRRFFAHKNFDELKPFITSEKILTLRFSENEVLHWENDGKELEWQDKLYDVIEISHVEGRLIVRCVEDQEESDMVFTYKTILGTHQDRDLKCSVQSVHDLKYTIPAFASYNIIRIHRSKLHDFIQPIYSDRVRDIPCPPPDALS